MQSENIQKGYAYWFVTLFVSVTATLLFSGASIALAALTLSGTSISGDSTIVIDTSSTISIGAASSTGITIGNTTSAVFFPGTTEIGTTSTSTNLNASTLTIVGNQPLELHSDYANGIDLYTHADAEFRAPYISLYKSRGTEASPTALQYTGYEQDSIGGINFGGWDGSEYGVGAAIYSQTSGNWTPTSTGGFLSIYDTFNGRTSQNQVIQFGGVDPEGDGPATYGNIISYRAITFSGNQPGDPGIFPSENPAVLSIERADQGGAAALTALTFQVATGTFSSLATCASGTEGTQAAVTDANTYTWGASITGGGTSHVLAYCDGTNWTVMAR
jgi:hypothetical protein